MMGKLNAILLGSVSCLQLLIFSFVKVALDAGTFLDLNQMERRVGKAFGLVVCLCTDIASSLCSAAINLPLASRLRAEHFSAGH